MTVRELIDSGIFSVVNEGGDTEKRITRPYCCDLLSIAMSKAPAGSAWVTVMGNMNTLAVASLADVACVIMAEGIRLDEAALKKAADQQITVMETDLSEFEAALKIYQGLSHEADL